MTQRLVLMEEIAKSKWNAGLPVEDVAREAVVLEKTMAIAVGEGLKADSAARVLRAQIAAAKIVQRKLFDRWRITERGKFPDASDLGDDLRPEVSRLSNALIAALAAANDALESCLAPQILSPVPPQLASFPGAWKVAVEGTVTAPATCPSAVDGR